MNQNATPRAADGTGATVTLDDVARVSGVSPAAASRALNGRSGVREDVRVRVRHVAESLGYRPNRAAKNLASGRTSVIGLVMPSDELRVDPYGASLVQAVANSADRHDEGLMLLLAQNEPSRAVSHMIRDGLIDGVVVSVIAIGARWIEELFDAQIPTVLIGAHSSRSDVHQIQVESHEAIVEVVHHLAEQGCERIAHIHGPLRREDAQQRLDGFRAAHAQLGRPVDESLIVEGDYSRITGQLVATELLGQRPDAIVAANDETAIGAIRAVERAGLTVPHDVAVTGFDGTAAREMIEPALTTLRQPFAEMSDLAVDALVSILAGDEVPLEQLVHPILEIAASSLRVVGTSS